MSEDRNVTEPESGANSAKGWQPSRKADHQLRWPQSNDSATIIERKDQHSWLRNLYGVLNRPIPRAIIAVCIFIIAAIIFDATLNGGSWTEKQSAPRPAAKKVRSAAPAT